MFIFDRPDFSVFVDDVTDHKDNNLFRSNEKRELSKKLEKSEKCCTSLLEESLKELDELVGLKNVKELIERYLAFVKIQDMRAVYSLLKLPPVMNMIFKGNPGTGKTTVARLVGKIFNAAGILDKGQIIEASRVDLVGEYIGHTAQKTKNLIEKALGGVLFIDEAYALARGGNRDFGREAVDTIVKYMEDKRQELIIILAGYTVEMEQFLDLNPGLNSRFALKLEFPDYTVEELIKIADLMYKKREYILSPAGKNYLYKIIKFFNNSNKMSGNGRMIRNIVESSIRYHANRISAKKVISRKDLMLIKRKDLLGVVSLGK